MSQWGRRVIKKKNIRSNQCWVDGKKGFERTANYYKKESSDGRVLIKKLFFSDIAKTVNAILKKKYLSIIPDDAFHN